MTPAGQGGQSFEFAGFRLPGGPVFARAAGTSMWDEAGCEYLDLAMGFGVYLHGHGAQAALLHAHADAGAAPGLGDIYTTSARERTCELLCNVAADNGMATGPDALSALVLHTGSEAVETALKTALLATGRSRVATFARGYHGTFGLALAATHRPAFREPFAQQYGATVDFHPYGEVPQLDERVACVIVEPVQGRAGVYAPPAGFLRALRAACDTVGALLVVDSVLVGCGRTGVPLEGAACGPDLLCLGKALGAGVPASAVVARRRVAEAAWGATDGEVIHTSTFLGHPLACAAIERTLLQLLPDAGLAGQHGTWHAALAPLAEARSWQLRGAGLLWALDTGVAGGGVALAHQLLERAVIVAPSGERGESITLTPSATVSQEQLAELVHALTATT